MTDNIRVQVIMKPEEAERFERYCHQRGHKKSTLIARLIRDHLDDENFQPQAERFSQPVVR